MKKKTPFARFWAGRAARCDRAAWHGRAVPPAQKRALGPGGSKSARATRAMRHARAGSGPSVPRSNPGPDRGPISSISRTEDRTEEDRSGPVRAGPRSGPVSDRKLHSPRCFH